MPTPAEAGRTGPRAGPWHVPHDVLPGGLPGDGWDGRTIIQKAPSTDASTPADAHLEGERVVIDQVYRGVCDGQTIAGQTDTGRKFD